jgi:hypothetical protein
VVFRPVQVLVRRDQEGEVADRRDGRATQHEAVMVAVFVAAQVDGLVALLGHDEPELADVELPRALKVGNEQLSMCRADNIERCGDAAAHHRLRVSRPCHHTRPRSIE